MSFDRVMSVFPSFNIVGRKGQPYSTTQKAFLQSLFPGWLFLASDSIQVASDEAIPRRQRQYAGLTLFDMYAKRSSSSE
jgi:hypothetical protein